LPSAKFSTPCAKYLNVDEVAELTDEADFINVVIDIMEENKAGLMMNLSKIEG